MIFGGLSENEVIQIKTILNSENVHYQVKTDHSIMVLNQASMQNNLRHLTPANISKNILAIELSDEDFYKLSDKTLKELEAYGICSHTPVGFYNQQEAEEFIHPSHHILEGNKRAIGLNLIHILFLIILVFILALIYNNL